MCRRSSNQKIRWKDSSKRKPGAESGRSVSGIVMMNELERKGNPKRPTKNGKGAPPTHIRDQKNSKDPRHWVSLKAVEHTKACLHMAQDSAGRCIRTTLSSQTTNGTCTPCRCPSPLLYPLLASCGCIPPAPLTGHL